MQNDPAQLRGLLWFAYHEFNAIRARSGAPLSHDGMKLVSEDWWSEMTDAFEQAIGEDATTPWPSLEANLTAIMTQKEGNDACFL